MKRYYKIDVQGHGGEYTMGLVNEESEVNLLRKLAQNNEMGWLNSDENTDLCGYDIDDVLHSFGGEVNDVTLNITEI